MSLSAKLFNCLKRVRSLNAYYIFTFDSFIRLFRAVVLGANKFTDIEERISSIQENLLKKFHTWVTRGIMDTDRFVVTLLLGVTVSGKSLDSKESSFLFSPQTSSPTYKSPLVWLTDGAWTQICSLSELHTFKGLSQSFKDNEKAWRKIFEKDEPHEYKLPGVWRQKLDEF